MVTVLKGKIGPVGKVGWLGSGGLEFQTDFEKQKSSSSALCLKKKQN
jgi:hypothetical protein